MTIIMTRSTKRQKFYKEKDSAKIETEKRTNIMEENKQSMENITTDITEVGTDYEQTDSSHCRNFDEPEESVLTDIEEMSTNQNHDEPFNNNAHPDNDRYSDKINTETHYKEEGEEEGINDLMQNDSRRDDDDEGKVSTKILSIFEDYHNSVQAVLQQSLYNIEGYSVGIDKIHKCM